MPADERPLNPALPVHDVSVYREVAAETARCVRELRAAAGSIYLRDADEAALAAAVAVVTPLGAVALMERIPLQDAAFASVTAYRTGRTSTSRSTELLKMHPQMAVQASFPFIVTSAPLKADGVVRGALTIAWAEAGRSAEIASEEQERMAKAAHTLSGMLDGLVADGVPLTPPAVPFVVTGDPSSALAVPNEGTSEAITAYHLHKLALRLASETTTEGAAEAAMERLVHGFGASGVAFGLIESGRLHLVGATGCSAEYLRALSGIPLSKVSPEATAVAQREQVMHTVDSRDSARLSQQATNEAEGEIWWILPLLTADRAIGTCSIGYRRQPGDPVDGPSALTSLATLLGQTFHRTQVADAQRMLAQKLQETLLPRVLPQTPGLASTCRYAPAEGAMGLGGDWYDLVESPGGIVAVVGDVEGHNTSAAVVMGELRSAIRAYATEGHDPTTILTRTNRLMIGLSTGLFATCCVAALDPETGSFEVALAGHAPPLIHGADGAFRGLHADAGPPLGVDANPAYRSAEEVLTPGTLAVLHTGPWPEPANGGDQEFVNRAVVTSGGELETLGDLLIDLPGRSSRTDDRALLLLRYEGPSADAQRYVRRLEIPHHDLQGVSRARKFLRDCMREWDLGSVTDEAELLASELVTNALVHGDSDVDVRLRRYPEHIRMEVRDSTSTPAVPVTIPREEDRAEGGRGLVIVEALARAWGNSPSGRGKTVWFEMSAHGSDRGRAPGAGRCAVFDG
ncbi:ATP-binding SpoIIE family protein phosphatase [Streptomyces luteolifulvus]|nr:ATP-binding SpoIIE family protein phosphatase [Streptomyces luteolifulvus]